MEQNKTEQTMNSETVGTTVGITLPYQNFDVWAVAVRKQMLSALKKRGHQIDN